MRDLKVRKKPGPPRMGVDALILMKIENDLKARAQRAAREQDISMSAWIRAAMTKALEEARAA